MRNLGCTRFGRTAAATATAALLPLALAACDGGPTAPDGTATVSLALTGSSSGGGASTSLSPTLSVEQADDQGNELRIDSVQVVLREIELDRRDDAADCSPGDTGTDDGCEEFETGIRLLRVPLDGTTRKLIEIQPPPAIYDELEFEIHKPDDEDPEGRQFIADNPTFADVSIRAKGTFNGQDFVFTQDVGDEQEIVLSPPLEVGPDAGPLNVTLRLDVSSWFVQGDGTLVDPVTANKGGANESLVEENIKQSIEAFGDDDLDGEEDDG